MKKTTYIKHPNGPYRGNPLIEGLSPPLSLEEFRKKSTSVFNDDLDLSGIDEELHSYYTRTSIDNLNDTYVVQDEAYRLYEIFRRMIESGYAKRNPLKKDIRKLLATIEKDKNFPLKSANLRALGISNQANNFLIAGISGRGKTSIIEHILQLLDEIIVHRSYTDAAGNEIKFDFTQIGYIYIQVHHRRGQKSILLTILETIDDATGENYQHHHRNSTVSTLITAVRKAFILHGVGIVFIDEAQNIAGSPGNQALVNNEKITMKFIEEIVNRVGIPTVFIGTFSTLDLFTRETTIGRRALSMGSVNLVSCDLNSAFWGRFIKAMCPTHLLKNQTTPLDTLHLHIHELSAGTPAIAASLIKATLAYLTFLPGKEQDLGIKALNHIFHEQFQALKPALDALKDRDYWKYDDLAPMVMLEEINNMASSRSVIENKVNALEQQLLQGEVKIKTTKSTVDDTKARKKSAQLDPDTLLTTLGIPTGNNAGATNA